MPMAKLWDEINQHRLITLLLGLGLCLLFWWAVPAGHGEPAASAQPSWFVRTLDEADLADLPVGTLAFVQHESTFGERLYRLDTAGQQLTVLNPAGQLLAVYDLPPLPVPQVEGFVAAASSDPTDDPAQVSIYLSAAGQVLELVYQPVVTAGTTGMTIATLEEEHDLWQLSPPSPDSAGVAYISTENQLLVSDSEVDETIYYFGVNTFYLSLTGNLLDTNDTTDFSDEPTGVAFNPFDEHIYFSDDDQDYVFVVCSDCDTYDVEREFETDDFGSNDPEGLTYDTIEGHLFIVDGSGREVYDVNPGPDGHFGNGNDTVTHFDVASLGASDPEGIAFDAASNRLLVLDSVGDRIFVVSRSGTLLDLIDISDADAVKPAGITLAPASDGSGTTNLYIVDRGIDNNDFPPENDGKLYEMSLPAEPPTPTPTSASTPTPTPSHTPSPTASSTATPTPSSTPPLPPTDTATATASSTATLAPTATPTLSATNTATATPLPIPSDTPLPTMTPTSPAVTATPTVSPSATNTPPPGETPTPPDLPTRTPTATPGVSPTPTRTGTPPSTPPPLPTGARLFLPQAFHLPNKYGEPNDSCSQAHELFPDSPRQFYAEDFEDWYHFTLPVDAQVTVQLSQFAPLAGQIAVYRGATCGSAEFLANNGNLSLEKTVNLGVQAAAHFFIFVSNDGVFNDTQPYVLLIETQPLD